MSILSRRRERDPTTGVIEQTLFVPEPRKVIIRQFTECRDCAGSGQVYVVSWYDRKLVAQTCHTCRGSGEEEIE